MHPIHPAPQDAAHVDVAIVGGGLAGLAAAALLARRGRRVVVLEKARELGGRARTQTRGEFCFNLGPHALYRGGAAARTLRELGVHYSGGQPRTSGFAVASGIAHTMPGGFVSLLSTRLLPLPAKLEAARLLATLPRIDASRLAAVSLEDWLGAQVRQAPVRALLQALFRLSTYAGDLRQSAGVAVAQLQSALAAGVVYLDGGWQTLVDGLRAAATAAGAVIETGIGVTAIEHDGVVRGVRLADGSRRPVAAAVVAAGPADALALLADGNAAPLRAWAATAVPVRAACLDVALSHLPRPRATFALGIDRPLYCSVHSAVARLGPAGCALVQVAKYLPSERTDPADDERELAALLDLVQPGWRSVVVDRRFLPQVVVSSALPLASSGGLAGRPGPAVPGIDGCYVAGDWVGAEGLLADASIASAAQAANLLLRDGARPASRPALAASA